MTGRFAPGFDAIPTKLVKDNIVLINTRTIKNLTNLLLPIINFIIDMGQFPNSLNIAKMIPVYKSGPKTYFVTCITTYLIVVHILSKLIKKSVKQQLTNCLTLNNWKSDCQYGFRER